jgi:hypothetical protein
VTPLVSIITPVGPRHAEHARTAAASVQWQSLAHLCEHVIACDGGADVAPMANVTILPSDGERRGPAHTRNRALAAAHGLFILPLDADDYLTPRAVETLLREYGRGQWGYVYGDTYTLERDGRFMLRSAPDYAQNDMRHHNIHVVTALTPTKHWRAVGGWDEGVDAWEDWSRPSPPGDRRHLRPSHPAAGPDLPRVRRRPDDQVLRRRARADGKGAGALPQR